MQDITLPELRARALYREPTLQEIDDFPGEAPKPAPTPRQRAQAANTLISALMPGANRAARRKALQDLQRKQKRAGK